MGRFKPVSPLLRCAVDVHQPRTVNWKRSAYPVVIRAFHQPWLCPLQCAIRPYARDSLSGRVTFIRLGSATEQKIMGLSWPVLAREPVVLFDDAAPIRS